MDFSIVGGLEPPAAPLNPPLVLALHDLILTTIFLIQSIISFIFDVGA
jgi:hypothetical protein